MSKFIQSQINIQLTNSRYIRRMTLESAIVANKIQQSTIKIKELQTLKRKRIDELKKRIGEISSIAKELHLKEFPKFTEEKEDKIIEPKTKKEKAIQPARSSEENDLMRELDEIKSKLDSISL